MSMTKNHFGAAFFLIGLLASPARVVAQANEGVAPFCDRDEPSEIAAYCQALTDFQSAVNEAKAKEAEGGPAPTINNFKNMLNRLDFSHADAAANFIRAAAGSYAAALAASTALTKAATLTASSDAGAVRPDQQFGSSGNTSGTTTLVSKAGSAELFSLALDTGALTQSANGTTTTLSTNVDQVFRLITGRDPDCTVTCKNLGWFEDKVLNPITISATSVLYQVSSKTEHKTGQARRTT